MRTRSAESRALAILRPPDSTPECQNDPDLGVYNVLSLEASVKARMSFGGTAPDRVREQLFFWREKLK